MAWSNIKRAINSTLGTENFKPLDQIIIEKFQYIVDLVNGLKASLKSGKNDFISKKSKEADFSHAASDVIEFDGSSSEYTLSSPKSGIYICTFYNITNDSFFNAAFDINNSVLDIKRPADAEYSDDYIEVYPFYGRDAGGGNSYASAFVNKSRGTVKFSCAGNMFRIMSISFIGSKQ